MNSREKILTSLRAAKSGKIELPVLDFSPDRDSLLQNFINRAILSGMEVLDIAKLDLIEVLNSIDKNKNIQSSLEDYEKQFPLLLDETNPFMEENVPDVYVCEAHFGVAENAAMWFDDEVLPSRILAFLPEELIILLHKDQIVASMHQAYNKIDKRDFSYGLFIAGPSKTADIEQTLVTGAQGAKRVRVFLR